MKATTVAAVAIVGNACGGSQTWKYESKSQVCVFVTGAHNCVRVHSLMRTYCANKRK